MAGFRIRETGEYLNSEFALREYRIGKGGVPAQITEDWLNSIGMDVVFEGPQATPADQYGFSYFAGLEEVEGKWFTKYAVGPVFQDDDEGTAVDKLAAYKAAKDADHAAAIRSQRATLLAECDWTQLADAPVDAAVWATYRQALRDVPAQTGFPWNVQWPAKPE
jgi:hypothetical protein